MTTSPAFLGTLLFLLGDAFAAGGVTPGEKRLLYLVTFSSLGLGLLSLYGAYRQRSKVKEALRAHVLGLTP